MKASYVINGDTVMVTLDVPATDVHVRARPESPGTIAITMEGISWHDAARQVLRQVSVADHELHPDVIADRALTELRGSVARGATSLAEPDVQRRRAVTNAMHKLGDLVKAGTVQELCITWSRETPSVSVDFTTGPLGRRRRRKEIIPIELPAAPPKDAAP